MTSRKIALLTSIVALCLGAAIAGCDKNKKSTATGGVDVEGMPPAGSDEEKVVVETKSKIVQWMGEQASKSFAASAEKLAKSLGMGSVADPRVTAAISKLTGSITSDKKVKKILDKIADEATSGLANKLKLGWKALTSGGVDAYKKKLKEKTTRIGTEVMNDHAKNKILQDKRAAAVIKKFMPVLAVQAQLAAATLQSKMSPKVAQKVFGIALKISAAGKSSDAPKQVEQWISGCDGHVEGQIETLFDNIAKLPTVKMAIATMAVDVLNHPTTKRELAEMTVRIMKNKDANKAMIEAYDNVAFDRGDKKIKASIEKIVNLPVVDDELFATMEKLAASPGAGSLMEKHLSKIGEDPAMAKLVDDFFINLIVTCGDPMDQ